MMYWYTAQPNELLIDLDEYMRPLKSKGNHRAGPWGERMFRRRLAAAIRSQHLQVFDVYLSRSISPHKFHAIIKLCNPLPEMIRMAWQFRLGSDINKSMADIMRSALYLPNPSLLILPNEIPDFYRPPDAMCKCTQKHTKEGYCTVFEKYRGPDFCELFGEPLDGEANGWVALPIGKVPLDLIMMRVTWNQGPNI